MMFKRYIRVLKILVKMKISKDMAYRFSFFNVFLVDGILFIIQILMFKTIYANVERIGDFDQWQMLFFIGTFSLINALNMAIFFFGLITIPGKVQSGEMDYYITKPIHSLFHITFESINPGSVLLVPASVLLLVYAGTHMDIALSFLRILGYILYVVLMLILFYDMMVIFRTFSFFTQRVDAIERMEGELIGLCLKIPGSLFKGVYKVIFYGVLPYGIMATIPTEFFTGLLSWHSGILSVCIVLLFTVLTQLFWKAGLKSYKSFSS